jgi:uncharacterized coiled-coil protein SlyX
MTNQQKLQAEIDQINAEIAERQDLLNRRQEQLDALPRERVRLRTESVKHWIRIEAESNPVEGYGYIAAISAIDCKANNIDPAALAAHICRFGEPDVTREMEALEAAVRAYKAHWDSMRGIRCGIVEGQKVMESLTALDAARKGGA